MEKVIKRVYIPSGMLVSMFNLYAGRGRDNEYLSLSDVELLCALIEYYFNYTDMGSDKYIYRFYTIPHFYTSVSDIEVDETLKRIDRILNEKYAVKLDNDSVGSNKNREMAARELFVKKLDMIPENGSYWVGKQILKAGQICPNDAKVSRTKKFVMDANKVLPNDKRIVIDNSTFYYLNPEQAGSSISNIQREVCEKELTGFINSYFSSNVYKIYESMLGKSTKGNFAPDVNTFVNCFKKASADFLNLGFIEVNNEYLTVLDEDKVKHVQIYAV